MYLNLMQGTHCNDCFSMNNICFAIVFSVNISVLKASKAVWNRLFRISDNTLSSDHISLQMQTLAIRVPGFDVAYPEFLQVYKQ